MGKVREAQDLRVFSLHRRLGKGRLHQAREALQTASPCVRGLDAPLSQSNGRVASAAFILFRFPAVRYLNRDWWLFFQCTDPRCLPYQPPGKR
jgi:hypothetical protein